MRKNKLPVSWIVAVSWLLLMLLSVQVIHGSLAGEMMEKKSDAELVLQSEASRLQYAINSRLLNLHTLEVLVRHDGGMLCDFERHASHIYESDPCVRCIQLAPNGVITHIYPLEGNENAFGNLFVNALRKEEALHAKNSGEMTLGGPYDLHQGVVGVVARRPVYLSNEDGEEVFWGLAIMVLDFPELLRSAELQSLTDSGYSYRLWRYHPETGEPGAIAGEETLPDAPITEEIKVPGGVWYLSLVPTGGWFNAQMQRSAIAIFLIINLLTLLLALLILRLGRSNEQLKLASSTDRLTGLYNSREFYATIAELSLEEKPFFLYFLDLDKFKEVNDTYGHAFGNALLSIVAERIRSVEADRVKAFRIGGDEFAVIRQGSGLAAMKYMQEELKWRLNLPFVVEGITLHNTISCGCAAYPEECEDAESVMQLADSRMYEAKAKNSVPVALTSRDTFFQALRGIIEKDLLRDPDQNFYFYHIDFKDFKLINYTYGVQAGDELMKRCVSYINNMAECVLCSRGFADRLFFVTREPASVTKEEVQERYWQYYSEFIQKEQKNFPDILLSCNCGMTQILGSDVDSAAGRANIGRVLAKNSYKDRAVFVEQPLVDAWMDNRLNQSRILLAARKKRIHYLLQPIMSLSTGKMVCAEALGRLEGECGALILPADFIPVLKKSRDIIEYDMTILEQVCRDIQSRQEAGKSVVPVSVNLSPLHLDEADTPERIRKILESHGVDPALIHVEITEDVMMNDLEKPVAFCRAMHEIGIRISLDDFGAGYINFEMLRRLPIDTLKIDKNLLTDDVNELSRAKMILMKILSIASELSIPVICEGTETEEQCKWLKEKGAEFVQGYYFSKPAEPDSIYESFL